MDMRQKRLKVTNHELFILYRALETLTIKLEQEDPEYEDPEYEDPEYIEDILKLMRNVQDTLRMESNEERV